MKHVCTYCIWLYFNHIKMDITGGNTSMDKKMALTFPPHLISMPLSCQPRKISLDLPLVGTWLLDHSL